MQKHAYQGSIEKYKTVFDPLPVSPHAPLFYDKQSILLRYVKDFPKLHYHDRYEIGICQDGEGLFLSDGIYATMRKGDIIFVPPGKHHYSRSLHEDVPCRCRFLYIHPHAIEKCLQLQAEDERSALRCYAERIPPILRSEEAPHAYALFSDIEDFFEKASARTDMTVVLRASLLLLEAQEWFSPPDTGKLSSESNPSNHEAAVQIAEYLTAHYRENQTAKELAALCHLSESQLRRKFLSAYGMPPIAYRNALRCGIGAELLLRTELSIAQIADRLGYSSPSDFYRMFKKLRGISPLAYRKGSVASHS